MWHNLRSNFWIADGVYRNMRRAFLCLLCSFTALAQTQQQTPIDTAIQAFWNAREHGRFNEAAAKREEARGLLAQMPVEAPQFSGWVQSVTQLYQGGGMYARARDVAEAALARTGRLPDAHPTRILLLNMLAGFWQEDRNLLKSAAYLEKVVSVLEAAPSVSSAASGPGIPTATRFAFMSGPNVWFGNSPSRGGTYSRLGSAYQRLATLYQQLGRPDALAAVLAKMKNLGSDSDFALASLYESQGRLDDAAAVYQRQVSQAAGDPQQAAGSLQNLAYMYQREQRYNDAVAVLQQAIATLDTSPSPDSRAQSMGMRQSLAGMLSQAGQTGQADQLYRQLLAESQSRQDPNYAQVLTNYANYLDTTKRSDQAASLLSDYMDSHPQLEPWQESNLLYARAAAARASGDSDAAAVYERAATDKRRATTAPPPEQPRVTTLLEKALAAASVNPEEAFNLTLEALEAAPRATDRDQVAWHVPNIAANLAARKAPAKAEQLYQHLFGTAQSWSAENLQPILNVAQYYARFLMNQKDRQSDAPEAIDRYRKLLMTAHGAATGHLQDPLEMTIDFERSHGSPKEALLAAQDLLALEESLSGATSEPYLHAVQTLASLYETGGDNQRAIHLLRQAVVIGDLALPFNDARRGNTRTHLAFALTREKQFDEAERLVNEAIAIGKQMHPSQADQFVRQLEEIRKMRPAPTAKAGQP